MPTIVPGLRSPYDQLGGIYAFGRMLDKIRLNESGLLPEAYHSMLGETKAQTLDARCCRLLHVRYADVVTQVKQNLSDDEILAWAFSTGTLPSAEEIEIWNSFLLKRGWRDVTTPFLHKLLVNDGFAPDSALTFFDHMDLDEGRPLRFPPDPAPPATPVRGKNKIPDLRSPHAKVGNLVHFGRMLDKIRLSAAGTLPPDWEQARGVKLPIAFDNFCCRFLRLDYAALETETLKGGSDESLLEWAFTHGRRPTDDEIEIWNGFISKRGWRDAHTPRLHFRLEEAGFPIGAALTMFDFIDLDEAA